MVFAVIIVITTAFGGRVAADTSSSHAKTQVLLYLVGSDLETKDATGTADLKEITGSYENTDPQKLDVVVAFGGANKAGWQGMRVATIEQLKEDAKDGKFGNGQYLYSDTSADMGSGQSLAKFLNVVKTSRTADRTILILSDHGNSYDGIGNDDITNNQLKMGDIDGALKESGVVYEPILFDACLMASVEVGKTVQPYTRVMLGSEEIQRGSFDYSNIIEPLVANPDTDPQILMKKLTDAYIDSKSPAGKAKTMAVIDVTKVPAIKDSLNELGAILIPIAETDEGLHDLKSAYNGAIRLGVTGGGKPTSVDLVSLLENIEKKRPEVSPQVQKTLGIVKSAVVYERHNEYSQSVSGISIASPDAMDISKYNTYGEAVRVAPQWDEFFKKMVDVSQGSASGIASPPEPKADTVVSSDTVGDKKYPDKKVTLSKPRFIGKGNGSYELRDVYNDASVFVTYYLVNGSTALSIGSQPVSPDTNGLYQLPVWDGRWYYFLDHKPGPGTLWDQLINFLTIPAKKPQPFLVDMEYDDVTSGGFTEYNSWISIQNQGDSTDATLVTYVNTTRNLYELMITPYSATKDGNELFGRSMDRFDMGSEVTSYTTGFDLRTQKPGEYTLAHTTAGPDMAPDYAILPDGTYAAGIMAYYDNDDEVLTDQFRIITIRNGAVATSTVGPLLQA